MMQFINEQVLGFANKFKIPTILGLAIIILGLVSGVYLVLRDQNILSQAAPNLTPQNITFTNITESSVVISWQTSSGTTSFITFGQSSPGEQTVLDDRDTNIPKPYLIHYVTLKNLLPKTSYQFKIISGKVTSEVKKFETTVPLTNQTGFTPIIGSVLDGNSPVQDGVVYLSVTDAATQSSLIKGGGNFLIPLSQISKVDLSDTYQLTEGALAKLTIHSDKGEANVLLKLKANSTLLPPIKLGQNIDLTIPEEILQSPSASSLDQYDLNSDEKINSTDYAILSACLGKRPNAMLASGQSCTKADIDGNGVVDQKDLSLMSQKLKNQ
ncbi:MAG: dockerin type I domain-containing protein [Candidatus Daviesbacteria bacterium]|nr:dockerin type I domain-containing protein [Candidatus Daviesbacteria bacterium]